MLTCYRATEREGRPRSFQDSGTRCLLSASAHRTGPPRRLCSRVAQGLSRCTGSRPRREAAPMVPAPRGGEAEGPKQRARQNQTREVQTLAPHLLAQRLKLTAPSPPVKWGPHQLAPRPGPAHRVCSWPPFCPVPLPPASGWLLSGRCTPASPTVSWGRAIRLPSIKHEQI